MGLDFLADNLHAAWRVPSIEGMTDASLIAGWLTRWRSTCQSFVVLDNFVTGFALDYGVLANRTVFCNSGGLITPALTRAFAILNAS